MKATVSEVTNILDGINSWLDIAEEKINEFEDIAIETVRNETCIEKNWKMNRASVSCGQLQEDIY